MQHCAISSVSINLDIPPARVKPKRHWRVIVHDVAKAFGVEESAILSTSRHRYAVWPRQAVYHLLREERGLAYPTIGRLMKRDHSSVIYGCKQAAIRIEDDPEFAAAYREAARI